MNWLEGLLYGIVSGLSDFLPISSTAHQILLINLFGMDTRDPVCDLFVHIALLLAIYAEYRSSMIYIYRLNRMQRGPRHRNASDMYFDVRLIKNAAIPLIIGLFLYPFTYKIGQNLMLLSLFLILNGIILFLPSRLVNGNKDARLMTLLDSILIGLGGAMSVFPGVSRVGTMTSVAIMRSADKQHAMKWAYLLSVPAIVFLAAFDITQIFTQSAVSSWLRVPAYLLSAIGAYFGGCISIRLMRFLTRHAGFATFSYYSWGAAFFSFILYLLV